MKVDLPTSNVEIAKIIVPAITAQTEELFKTVREYESDTFSAEASKLTKDEARKITIALIAYALQELIDLDRLDGVRLSEELENIRPDED